MKNCGRQWDLSEQRKKQVPLSTAKQREGILGILPGKGSGVATGHGRLQIALFLLIRKGPCRI